MDDLESRITALEEALLDTQNYLRVMIVGQLGERFDPWPENGPLEDEPEDELDPIEAELRGMLSE